MVNKQSKCHLEAITGKVSGCTKDNGESNTNTYQKHTDCVYGYKLVCCYDDKYSMPVETYHCEGAVNKFMKKMLEEFKYCKKIVIIAGQVRE